MHFKGSGCNGRRGELKASISNRSIVREVFSSTKIAPGVNYIRVCVRACVCVQRVTVKHVRVLTVELSLNCLKRFFFSSETAVQV